MLTKLFLALRNNAHQVKVIKPNGETRPVLGRSLPEDEDRRANALRQWGIKPESPRNKPLEGIDEPLPRRTQTILSHQLPRETQELVDTGMGQLADSRRSSQPGVQVTVFLRSGEDD